MPLESGDGTLEEMEGGPGTGAAQAGPGGAEHQVVQSPWPSSQVRPSVPRLPLVSVLTPIWLWTVLFLLWARHSCHLHPSLGYHSTDCGAPPRPAQDLSLLQTPTCTLPRTCMTQGAPIGEVEMPGRQ